MDVGEVTAEIFEDCADVSLDRLERGKEKLAALETQMKVGRKERFQMSKNTSQELAQVHRRETDLQKALETEKGQHESWRLIETRMVEKLQEIVDTLDARAAPASLREAVRLRCLEAQVEAIEALSSSELPDLRNFFAGRLWHRDREIEPLRASILEACVKDSSREAESAEVAAEAARLKEELASAMLRQAKADLAHLDADAVLPATATCSSQGSVGGGPSATGESDELRHLQHLRQELSRGLENEVKLERLNALEQRLGGFATTQALVVPEGTAGVTTVATVVATPVGSSALTPRATPSTNMAIASPAPAAAAAVPSSAAAAAVSVTVGTIGSMATAAPAPSSADGFSAGAATLTVKGACPAKGKGKGKGKGAAPKGPPPPAGKAPPAPGARPVAVAKKSNLLNIHWKTTKEPPPTEASSKDNGFLEKTSQVAAAFIPPLGSAGDEASQQRILKLEADACAQRRRELRLPPEASNVASGSAANPVPRDSVFANSVNVKVLPTPLLDVYFKARTTSLKMPSGDGGDTDGNGRVVRPALIEKKFLQMLGICLQRYLMAHKGETEASAVLSIKRAVLRCDYDLVRQEALALIRTVLTAHREDGSKVTKLVEQSGEAALLQLEQGPYHRLIHELLKVPQIDERLECMLFQTDFERSLKQCIKQLEVLKQALVAMNNKRDLLGKFFSTALRMGQGLNRDSRAPQAPRGFQLTSLEKLAQTKSTKSPKHSVLHFVIALMTPQDAEQLFTAEDRMFLSRAKALKSYTVYTDCIELVQGFYGLREICETGSYKKVKMERRRKTMVPTKPPASHDEGAESGKEDEAPIDKDDHFHDEMQVFVGKHLQAAKDIAKDVFTVFKMYKDLAMFFDDVSSLYPPPREENGSKVDLVGIFHSLAELVRVHRKEVDQDGLRDLITPTAVSSCNDPPATPLSICKDVPAPVGQDGLETLSAATAASKCSDPPVPGKLAS